MPGGAMGFAGTDVAHPAKEDKSITAASSRQHICFTNPFTSNKIYTHWTVRAPVWLRMEVLSGRHCFAAACA